MILKDSLNFRVGLFYYALRNENRGMGIDTRLNFKIGHKYICSEIKDEEKFHTQPGLDFSVVTFIDEYNSDIKFFGCDANKMFTDYKQELLDKILKDVNFHKNINTTHNLELKKLNEKIKNINNYINDNKIKINNLCNILAHEFNFESNNEQIIDLRKKLR